VRLLVLGGTQFVGRELVEEALARGQDVTLFNRGRTAPELFPTAEHLVGDRDGDLAALEQGEWDAVLDISGFVPRVVRASAELLAERVGHYTFVSSIGVYADFSRPRREESPLAQLGEPGSEDVREHYGALKAACEAVVGEVFGDRALLVRPGLIAGPHDPTGRFTYWAHRVRRGGEILAPGPPERRVQVVDVRDLAPFVLDLVEQEAGGPFNVTCEGVTWAELLAGREVAWVTDEFLVDQGVEEWVGLPLWIADPAHALLQGVDVSRAVAAGLRCRPVAETVRDAAEAPLVDGIGLTPEREAELLAAWQRRRLDGAAQERRRRLGRRRSGKSA